MQQTELFKLNKPEMDDTFSVAPLNENADRLEAALSALSTEQTAINQRQVLHKLMAVSPEEGTNELTIDMSNVDLTPYGALIVFYSIYGASNTTSMGVNNSNGLPLMASAGQYYSSNHGGGLAILVPAGDHIFCSSLFCNQSGSITGGARYGSFAVPWSGVSYLGFKPISSKATIALYGLRF